MLSTMRSFSQSVLLASTLLTATCQLSAATDSVLERDVDADVLVARSEFLGFSMYKKGEVEATDLPSSCKTALTQKVLCDNQIADYGGELQWRGYVFTEITSYESVCDASCGDSIRSYFDGVAKECAGLKVFDQINTFKAGRLLEGWTETCYYDPESGRNCNDGFSGDFEDVYNMPLDEMCSFCYVEHYRIMQKSPYSAYDAFYEHNLQMINEKCGLNNPTEVPFPLDPPQEQDLHCSSKIYHLIQAGETCTSIAKDYDVPEHLILDSYSFQYGGWTYEVGCDEFRAGLKMCIPEKDYCETHYYHTSKEGDTCASIAKAYGVASYDLTYQNEGKINDCNSIPPGLTLCMPPACDTYELQAGDTCHDLEIRFNITSPELLGYNGWINDDCSNLDTGRMNDGGIVCSSIPIYGDGEDYTAPDDGTSSEDEVASSTVFMTSITRSSPSEATTAAVTDGHTRPTGSVGDVAKTSSEPSGGKITAQTTGASAAATTTNASTDRVSAAMMMMHVSKWQIIALAFTATLFSYTL
ncbi:hypothetical protein E4T46_01629 [Aureobasidium subglaciale]|nr:hypothetical protein E4T40_01632 [Aureobasidium subglaciale]KAI5266370.1 hypothetical protein E4T46_01629 [Aureobasidium subglaciale]